MTVARTPAHRRASAEKTRPSLFWVLAAVVVPLVGLFAKVREDQAAKDLGILADVDTWRHDESGKTYNDYFLMAHNREEWVDLM